MEIVRQERVPLPVVKEILERLSGLLSDNPVFAKTLEYAQSFSKCGASEAREAVEKLKGTGFSEVAAVMLVNILPRDAEEAKAILGDIDGGYADDKVEQALRILSETCTAGEEG